MAGSLTTDFGFTGQRADSYINLYDYHARFYDPYLARFISADTIVPNPAEPQDFNRYAYVRNNPLKFVDPTGHYAALEDNDYSLDDCLNRGGCIYPEGHEKAGYLIRWDEKEKREPPMAPSSGAKVRSGIPGVEVSPTWEARSEMIDHMQLGMDVLESVISWAGSGTSTGLTLLGVPVGQGGGAIPILAIGTTMGADKLEDIPGWADVGLNVLGDIYGGSTYFDESANELAIGQDTIVTFCEQYIDTWIPSSFADIPLNALATAYDFNKLHLGLPNFLEWRLPLNSEGLPVFSEAYLAVYPEVFR